MRFCKEQFKTKYGWHWKRFSWEILMLRASWWGNSWIRLSFAWNHYSSMPLWTGKLCTGEFLLYLPKNKSPCTVPGEGWQKSFGHLFQFRTYAVSQGLARLHSSEVSQIPWPLWRAPYASIYMTTPGSHLQHLQQVSTEPIWLLRLLLLNQSDGAPARSRWW